MRKFGLVDIPAVNTDNVLIGGHQRIRIMIELGMADQLIDVRVPSRTLTEGEVREILIRLNKNLGEFSYDILANSFELDDLKAWGFSDVELGLGFDDNTEDGEPESEPKESKHHQCPSCSYKWKD